MSFQLMAWATEQTVGSSTEKAVLLAVANRTNHDTGLCCPSVARIAKETEFRETAVKTALRSLAEKGYISRSRRRRADGTLGSYEFSFPHLEQKSSDAPPEAANVSGTTDAKRLAEPRRETFYNQSLSPPFDSPPLGSVDRKPIKPEHEQLARQILAEWNRQTGQSLTALTHLRKIVARIREHPELGIDEHAHLIAALLAGKRWWDGNPDPRLVYGNDAAFEKALTNAKNPTSGGAMTPDQIMDYAYQLQREGR